MKKTVQFVEKCGILFTDMRRHGSYALEYCMEKRHSLYYLPIGL